MWIATIPNLSTQIHHTKSTTNLLNQIYRIKSIKTNLIKTKPNQTKLNLKDSLKQNVAIQIYQTIFQNQTYQTISTKPNPQN